MLSSNFPDEKDTRKLTEHKEEIDKELEEIVSMLESWAEDFIYLDDYSILVLEQSSKPIIIMSPDEFNKLHKKVLGNG